MVDYDGRTWGVILVRENDKLSDEVAFEIKDTLSIYEAARIASGRHPCPRILRGAGIDAYWVLTAGVNSKSWRRVRPQRSVDVFHALKDAVEQGMITPTKLVYLNKPTYRTKGDIDCRFTRVKTVDVARICAKKGWHPKPLRPPTEELQRELHENILPASSVSSDSKKSVSPSVGARPRNPLPASLNPELRKFLNTRGPCSETVAWRDAEARFGARITRGRIRALRSVKGARGRPQKIPPSTAALSLAG
jgi:hypothetical protein